ncbi:PREDICTED: uncharacterized protein LOC109153251 [Ipomoea nil]|uniref:uncharacterized protein LOC109153251 n=1 Tax=Ipomoea nil TaxID=35883 RepID=UPI000901145F|nr:PREDICTED: uncharacterized protein LOC109153251 [Ipomoea nil]
MATGWIKSLHCKSRALDDVVSHHQILPNSASCRRGVQGLKDVVETTKERKNRKPKPPAQNKRSVTRMPEPGSTPPVQRPRSSSAAAARHARSSSESAFYPTLTELPEGHPSRNVVEIIFHTSWSPKSFSGRVEMLFKVQNLPRTGTRFEEYREAVKKRAGGAAPVDGREDHARCVADGNEVMRFYCLGPTAAVYETGGTAWGLHPGKGTAICTFAGSGDAHERSGGGRGRRAMLVCRVIAGRVCKEFGINSLLEGRVGFDSVSGDSGELLVFDSRAVIPCFLIIYKL